MRPTVTDVTDYLGHVASTLSVATVIAHLTGVTETVRAYTRGQGFTDGVPGEDLAAVIVCACARSLSNPANLTAETVGALSVRYGAGGWTLPELAVLNTHRRRAA